MSKNVKGKGPLVCQFCFLYVLHHHSAMSDVVLTIHAMIFCGIFFSYVDNL